MIVHPSLPNLEMASSQFLLNLEKVYLKIAPEKIQRVPQAFLGFFSISEKIKPLDFSIMAKESYSLMEQKLC